MASTTIRTDLKNVSTGKRIVKGWLDEYELDTPFNDDRVFALLSYHPKGKAEHIEYCVMRNSSYNQRTLYFKNVDNTEDSISYVACVENLFGKYKHENTVKNDHIKAFRNATYDDYHREFKRANTSDGVGACASCHRPCGNNTGLALHVDHVDTCFNILLQAFLENKRVPLESVEISKSGMEPHLADDIFKTEWQEWHNSRVKYRILCGPCNMSFGDKSAS
jgi:hypothetical protein